MSDLLAYSRSLDQCQGQRNEREKKCFANPASHLLIVGPVYDVLSPGGRCGLQDEIVVQNVVQTHGLVVHKSNLVQNGGLPYTPTD